MVLTSTALILVVGTYVLEGAFRICMQYTGNKSIFSSKQNQKVDLVDC